MTFVDISLRLAVSLLPVFCFLIGLIALDSFKLVPVRRVLLAIVYGLLIAVASYFANNLVIDSGVEYRTLYRYVAPAIEEVFKAALVAILIVRNRIGFVVDAAIIGFAIGAGFAATENTYYVTNLEDATIFVWLVRGFGTAIMHGGATAIYATISKPLFDRAQRHILLVPGLVVAYVLHSLYNHILIPPIVSTALLLLILPLLLGMSFQHSERLTREWLGVGFDSDQELLELIKSGNIPQTRIGKYLQNLREHFAGEVIADMLCWLRIQVELSIKAKGIMLMREAGFRPQVDPATKAKLAELDYLEDSIGKTGILAIAPVVHASRRDVWQLQLLGRS